MSDGLLALLQQQFKSALLSNDTEILKEIKNSRDNFSEEERLEVYRSGVSARFKNSLIEDFPLVLNALNKKNSTTGDMGFQILAKKYIEAFPSHYQSLAEVSLNFPEFLKKEDPSDGISEIARFEVSKLLSECAESNSPTIGFTEISGSELNTHSLAFDSSVQIFESDWDVRVAPPLLATTYLLIYDNELETVVEKLNLATFKILSAIKNKNTIAEISAEDFQLNATELKDLFLIGFKKEFLLVLYHNLRNSNVRQAYRINENFRLK